MIAAAATIPILWRPSFSGGQAWRDLRPAGETLLEIARSVPGLPEVFWRRGVMLINGHPIARQHWHRVRSKPDWLVTLHLPLAGGGEGGSGKQVVALVAAIALTVATAGIAAGGLAPVFGATFAAGTFAAQAAAAATGVIGALAINALTPPPSSAAAGVDGGQDRAAASASGNVLAINQAIPRVIGTHRDFPPLACEPLIELVGDDEVVEVVGILNGPHLIEDVRFGEVDAAALDDVEVETREGWPDDAPLTLVTRHARTSAVSLELSSHVVNPASQRNLSHSGDPGQDLPLWHQVASRDAPDEIWLHINLPGGLADTADAGAAIVLPIRIRMRRRGETAWINLPELHVADQIAKQIRRAVIIKFTDDAVPANAMFAASGWIRACNAAGAEWAADGYFVGTGTHDFLDTSSAGSSQVRNVAILYNRVVIHMDPAEFGEGIWEIQVKRGCAFRASDFSASGYLYQTVAWSFFGFGLVTGVPAIAESREGLSDTCYLLRLASVWNEAPVQAPGFALVAARARNRRLDSLSVLASGYVRDWSGGGWTDWVTTSNPAPHYADVLTGSLTGEPLDGDLVDHDGLVAWRALCADNGWTVDAIIDDMRTQDALQLIASCGYARPYQSELSGVAVDRDTAGEAPVQIFSPRNSSGFRWEKAFSRSADGMIVSFRNRDLDYQVDQIVVYRTGYEEGDAPLLEQAGYDGLVDGERVETRVRFDLDQLAQRSSFYSLIADGEAIVCRRGDLVGVAHDAIQQICGAGYVAAAIEDGAGAVERLRLEQSVILAGDGPFGIAIRREDGSVTTHAIDNEAGETDEILLAAPILDGGTIAALAETEQQQGSLVTVGRLGEEFRRLKLFGIAPEADMRFRLTLVDEAPDLVRVPA